MKAKIGASLLLILCSVAMSHAQEIWTIGPMLHWHFGSGVKKTTSIAIEGAYWNVKTFPYGVDFGIEFDRGKFRMYTEAQTGIGVTGVALGPVLEFNTAEHKTRLGMQASAWANYYLGFDYRFRKIDNTTYHALGMYAKLPVATSGLDSDGDGSADWDDWD